MKVLFDHGTPAPLRRVLSKHVVATAYEMGWTALDNGTLLEAAEAEFDAFVTTDQNMRYQQNFKGRRLAILVLSTTSWPRIQAQSEKVAAAISALQPGDYVELAIE